MTTTAFMTLFADQPERAEGLDENLACALLTAVPMRIWEITHWTPEQRTNDAAWAAELMRAGAAGDVLLYGTKDGGPAAAFNALVRGLAALAFVEGGVEFAGLHWCTSPHIECPDRPATTRVQEQEDAA